MTHPPHHFNFTLRCFLLNLVAFPSSSAPSNFFTSYLIIYFPSYFLFKLYSILFIHSTHVLCFLSLMMCKLFKIITISHRSNLRIVTIYSSSFISLQHHVEGETRSLAFVMVQIGMCGWTSNQSCGPLTSSSSLSNTNFSNITNNLLLLLSVRVFASRVSSEASV